MICRIWTGIYTCKRALLLEKTKSMESYLNDEYKKLTNKMSWLKIVAI